MNSLSNDLGSAAPGIGARRRVAYSRPLREERSVRQQIVHPGRPPCCGLTLLRIAAIGTARRLLAAHLVGNAANGKRFRGTCAAGRPPLAPRHARTALALHADMPHRPGNRLVHRLSPHARGNCRLADAIGQKQDRTARETRTEDSALELGAEEGLSICRPAWCDPS